MLREGEALGLPFHREGTPALWRGALDGGWEIRPVPSYFSSSHFEHPLNSGLLSYLSGLNASRVSKTSRTVHVLILVRFVMHAQFVFTSQEFLEMLT